MCVVSFFVAINVEKLETFNLVVSDVMVGGLLCDLVVHMPTSRNLPFSICLISALIPAIATLLMNPHVICT